MSTRTRTRMRRVLALDVVGLTPRHFHEGAVPRLARALEGGIVSPLEGVLPAVTCSAQATMLTGGLPRDHGIVGNGWLFRHLREVWLWRQSNHLVAGEKVWEAARRLDPQATTAQLFWWFNMYSTCDWAVTPRPAYHADGRKEPDVYTRPAALRDELTAHLGPFPLFSFWGPGAGVASSRWIAEAARRVMDTRDPTLTLVYLPHLDYDLQRYGPSSPQAARALAEVDALAAGLVEQARAREARVLVVSEYGIQEATSPVHLNRALRQAGLLEVTRNATGELLDPGESRAFAVADHQVAHVYVRDAADRPAVRALLEGLDGVDQVLDEEGKQAAGLDHPRSGELVAVAAPGRWFTYYYWLDDRQAPDFARTVEIHRKPGYDPAELFLDPARPTARLRVAWALARKTLGFRYLMNVIPLDPSCVRGTHGRRADDPADGPVLATGGSFRPRRESCSMRDVKGLILEALTG